jgi:hypothetical protein
VRRRRLLNFLTLLSLLLCVAVVVLGMRDRDQFAFTASGRLWWVMWGVERVSIQRVEGWPVRFGPSWITDPRTRTTPLVAGAGPQWRDSSRERFGVIVDRMMVKTTHDGRWPPLPPQTQPTVSSESGFPDHLLTSAPMPFVGVRVPYLAILAAAAALPAVRLARATGRFVTRRTRATRGLCPACGYDVTGNASGICPECGTPLSSSSGVRA